MNDIYMRYTEIQKYLNTTFSTHHQAASLFDAIYSLYKSGNYDHSISDNLIDKNVIIETKHDLFEFLKRITVLDVTSIIHKPKQLYQNVTEDYFMFYKRDARILLQFQNEQTYLHYHNYFEINFVLQGDTILSLKNEKHKLTAGGFVIISPNTLHQINISENSIVVCITIKKSTFDDVFFNLLKDDNLLSQFFNYNLYSSNQNSLMLYTKIDRPILTTISDIFIETYSTAPQANQICCNYISILFSYILRNLIQTDDLKNNTSNITSKLVSIINFIKENSEDITLSILSQKFNYNPDYLGKLIKKNTGKSFNYLRNYYRIQKSCNLLKYTTTSIDEISLTVGYNSPNHFERCFQQFEKVSPRKYRKSYSQR